LFHTASQLAPKIYARFLKQKIDSRSTGIQIQELTSLEEQLGTKIESLLQSEQIMTKQLTEKCDKINELEKLLA